MKRIFSYSLLLTVTIVTAYINLGFLHEHCLLTLADLPIGKLTFHGFINKYKASTVKIIRFDRSTGAVLGLKFDDSRKYILIDTCQHEIARGRAAYTKRTQRVSLVNFGFMDDKESSCALSFLDDTLYEIRITKLPDMKDTTIRTDFTVARDFILKNYFTKPLVDTLRNNPSKEVCRKKNYVNQKAEILYTEKKQALKYEISQHLYDFGDLQCTLSSTIITTWYNIKDNGTVHRLWERDTTAVGK